MTWQALLSLLESGPDSATYQLTLDHGPRYTAIYDLRTSTWTDPQSQQRCGHGLILWPPGDGTEYRIRSAKPCASPSAPLAGRHLNRPQPRHNCAKFR